MSGQQVGPDGPIVYGLSDESLQGSTQRGEVQLGGCSIGGADPGGPCQACRHEWERLPHDGAASRPW